MAWGVEYTDEFEAWWVGLTEEEQIDIDTVVGLLEDKGPNLPYPYSSEVKGSKAQLDERAKNPAQREAIQDTLCAFDPRRVAILLLGGKKAGGARWYEKYVPPAERIYEQHLRDLKDNRGR